MHPVWKFSPIQYACRLQVHCGACNARLKLAPTRYPPWPVQPRLAEWRSWVLRDFCEEKRTSSTSVSPWRERQVEFGSANTMYQQILLTHRLSKLMKSIKLACQTVGGHYILGSCGTLGISNLDPFIGSSVEFRGLGYGILVLIQKIGDSIGRQI